MKHEFKIPYLCQYDNALYPGGSCNMTSLAMCLMYYGVKVTGRFNRVSDNLLDYCDQHGLDRHELAVIDQVAEHFGVNDHSTYDGKWPDIKKHLKTNNPVIVHGYFTPGGHILVLCGVDEDKGRWKVNDPAGDWTAPQKYRDPSRTGYGVWYPSAAFKQAAAPDGKVWCHFLSKPK